MDGVPANYLGRLVSKNNFRAFIYSPDGTKRLVNSWDEFEAHMQTGIWFAREKEAKSNSPEAEVKPKTKARVSRSKKSDSVPVMTLELKEEAPAEGERADDLAYEVKDDFLSDARK